MTGLVLSGGEPLLSPAAAELVSAARRLGYAIKLDTNGCCPGLLRSFLASPDTCPDYVALDVKTAPARYGLLEPQPGAGDGSGAGAAITESIAVVSALPPEKREFRTVLVPGLVTADDVREIARLLPRDGAWYFSPFRNGRCLDPAYDALAPYTDSQAEALVDLARETIPGARLR